jgi:hypothetical protein
MAGALPRMAGGAVVAISKMSRHVLLRPLSTAETLIVVQTASDLEQQFAANPRGTKAFLAVGESKPDPALSAPQRSLRQGRGQHSGMPEHNRGALSGDVPGCSLSSPGCSPHPSGVASAAGAHRNGLIAVGRRTRRAAGDGRVPRRRVQMARSRKRADTIEYSGRPFASERMAFA